MALEIKEVIEKIGTQFEEFKKENDKRLAEIERKGHADPLLEGKVDRISKSLNEIEDLKSQLEEALKRVGTPAGGVVGEAKSQHSKAFDGWMRKGSERYANELEAAQSKAYSGLVPTDGGYFVPESVDSAILDLLKPISPVRSLVSSITISTDKWEKRVNLHGTESGWVGSEDARPKTAGSKLALVRAPMGEIYANPSAPQNLLDDAAVNLESWIAQENSLEFSKQENIAFVTGDGKEKPQGFTAYPTAATGDDTRAYGTVEHVATGVSGGFAATNPQDVLLDLLDKFDESILGGAVWVMNGRTRTVIRKMKDENKQYLLTPGLSAGEATTLHGYPIVQINAMPLIAANSLSIAFGDFKRAYKIIDRKGISVLRDPYTDKPFVNFYTTKRVGGVLIDTQAIKFIKFI